MSVICFYLLPAPYTVFREVSASITVSVAVVFAISFLVLFALPIAWSEKSRRRKAQRILISRNKQRWLLHQRDKCIRDSFGGTYCTPQQQELFDDDLSSEFGQSMSAAPHSSSQRGLFPPTFNYATKPTHMTDPVPPSPTLSRTDYTLGVRWKTSSPVGLRGTIRESSSNQANLDLNRFNGYANEADPDSIEPCIYVNNDRQMSTRNPLGRLHHDAQP